MGDTNAGEPKVQVQALHPIEYALQHRVLSLKSPHGCVVMPATLLGQLHIRGENILQGEEASARMSLEGHRQQQTELLACVSIRGRTLEQKSVIHCSVSGGPSACCPVSTSSVGRMAQNSSGEMRSMDLSINNRDPRVEGS